MFSSREKNCTLKQRNLQPCPQTNSVSVF